MRVVFIIRRYWPLMTAAGRVVDRLARHLLQQGHDVLVLTAQADHLWPESLVVRGVPVQRFGLDAWSLFGRKTLGQRMSAWLEENPERWDVVVLCDVLEGAEWIFRVAESVDRPVLLSFFDAGPAAPLSKLLLHLEEAQHSAGAGNLCRRSAHAWLSQRNWLVVDVDHALKIVELQPEATVSRWWMGASVASSVEESIDLPQDRLELRAALGHSFHEVPDLVNRPWLVCASHGLLGIDSQWLWEFIRRLCERRADVIVWVVGDGPANSSLWRRAHEADLERRVLIPGCYGDLGDLFSAAELVVLPQTQWLQAGDEMLAITSGTPCLLAEVAVIRQWIEERVAESSGVSNHPKSLLPPQMDTWQSAVDSILDHPAAARQRALAQRQFFIEHLPQSRSLASFEAILRRLREVTCRSPN